MPIPIEERSVPKFISTGEQQFIRVNAVKVGAINIDVDGKRIMIRLQFGRMVDGNFVPVGVSFPVFVTGEEFLEIAQLKVEQDEVGMSAYDWIAKKVYDWLVAKGKI
jgi:hypothetical protein